MWGLIRSRRMVNPGRTFSPGRSFRRGSKCSQKGRSPCRWKSLSKGRRRVSQSRDHDKVRSTRSATAPAVDFHGSLVMAPASSASTHSPNWESVLNGHPIFGPLSGGGDDKNSWKSDNPSLELSISSLSNAVQDGDVPNGRRRTMLVKDADLIVAVGKQVRMSSLTESQLSATGEQTFKVMWAGETKYAFLIYTTLDTVRAGPPIRHPRARVKPEWTPSRGSWRIPGHGSCTTTSWVHKTRATNGRLQVRLYILTPAMMVDQDWEDLCRSASSTTVPVLHHKSPRSIGTHGVRVALPSL